MDDDASAINSRTAFHYSGNLLGSVDGWHSWDTVAMMRAAHFFDLGGTLLELDGNDEIAHGVDGQVEIRPGVPEGLARLAGTPVFVVTNQSGLADGTLSTDALDRFCAQLSTSCGGVITAFAVCAHVRDAGCECRKPRPGLVAGLAQAHGIDLAASVMVGDTETDRQLATTAGIGLFVWADDYFMRGSGPGSAFRPPPGGAPVRRAVWPDRP